MEIRITTSQILKVLLIIAGIIFVGISIDTFGYIFSAVYTMTINSVNARTTWPGVDLSALFAYDKGHFLVVITFMTIVSMLKATQFYLIVKLLYDKKLNLAQPFNQHTRRFILYLSLLAITAGLFAGSGVDYVQWLAAKGIAMPDVQSLRLGGADVWIYMGIMLFVIAQIFKRGIEIQTENDLTI